MVCKKRLAALGLALVMALSATACTSKADDVTPEADTLTGTETPASYMEDGVGEPVDSYRAFIDISEALLGEWESEDGVYKFTVIYDKEENFCYVQTLYCNGKEVEKEYVYTDDYGYADKYMRYEITNAYYLQYAGDMSAQYPIYIDGDKLLYKYEGEYIRMNRVGASEPLKGHSDLYIDVRCNLMGLWFNDDHIYYVHFLNGNSNGKLVFQLDQKLSEENTETFYYYVDDMVPADEASDVDTMGLNYVLVVTDLSGENTYKFPVSYTEDTMSIVIDGQVVELKSL